MARLRPLRFFCAIFSAVWLPATCIVRAENITSDLLSPGLLASDLMIDGERMISFSRTASDDTRVFAFLNDGNIARIDPALGTAELLPPAGRSIWNPEMDLDGNFILMSSTEWDDVNFTPLTRIHIDVLDLTTGTWRQRRTATLSGSHFSMRKVSVYKDEIRVTTEVGKILRWKISDMAALPTLGIPAGQFPYSNKLTALCATAVGTEFCAGVTYDENLVFEKNGVFRKQRLSRMYEANEKVWTSSQFIAVPTQEGTFVWDKSKITVAPRFVAPPIGFESKSSLWKGRFLLSTPSIVNQQSQRILRIVDLAKPASVSPLTIPLSVDFNVAKCIGISGGYFWSLGLGENSKHLLRFPVSASTNMVAVDVAPARAFESDGKLRFRVTADRPLTSPVTVNLRTVPGSAREGIDYIHYQGSVTLTPAKPTAEVVVTILPDQEMESYESLILEITGASGGAWRKRLFTTGVIEGSGFQRLKDIPAPAGPGTAGMFMGDWVLTESGVVARLPVNSNTSGFFIYRNGGSSWERLDALGTVAGHDFQWRRVIDTQGTRVVVAVDRVEPGAMEAYRMIVFDLQTNEILKSADGRSRKAWLHPQGLVMPYYPLENLPFASGGSGWTLPEPEGGGAAYFGFNDKFFVRASSQFGCQLINFSDGTVAGDFPPLRPESGKGDFVLAINDRTYLNRHGVILNKSGTGYPYHPFEIETGVAVEDAGVLMDRGIVLSLKPVSGNSIYQAIDGTTGAVLTTLTSDTAGEAISGASGVLAFPLRGSRTGLLDTNPSLPNLLDLKVTRNEGGDASPWMLRLSEATAFPITVSISTSSGEMSPKSASVVIPAGKSSVPFPMSVVDDSIPEFDQTIPLAVTLSGNGHTRHFSGSVKIPGNDFRYLSNPEYAANGTSIAVHPGGVVFGDSIHRVAAEVRYKKAVTLPVVTSTASFGHAVGLNKKYMVVGAPLHNFPVGTPASLRNNFVFVYKRKTGQLVSQYKDWTRNSAFGSVVHVTEKRFFVGAPDIAKGAVATGYAFGKTKPQRYKHPKSKLKASRFGTAIASVGKSVWIGAPGDGKGKVFQYDVASGKLRKTINPPVGTEGNFGQAIITMGSTIAISAPVKSGAASVFLFNATSGKLVKTIRTPFADGGLFGASLAVLKGDILAVGCPTSKFSPAGGVMLYDVSGAGYRLVTMLLPPKKSNDGEDRQVLKNLGMAGGLSGADGILGVVSLSAKNLLDVTEIRRDEDWPAPALISLLDLTGILPSKANTRAFAPEIVTGTPWEKAMGAGATEDTCKLAIEADEKGMTLLLPVIDSLAFGTELVLERSADLDTWTPVANLSNGGSDGWQPIADSGAIKPGDSSLPILPNEKTVFYRIRCHVP